MRGNLCAFTGFLNGGWEQTRVGGSGDNGGRCSRAREHEPGKPGGRMALKNKKVIQIDIDNFKFRMYNRDRCVFCRGYHC